MEQRAGPGPGLGPSWAPGPQPPTEEPAARPSVGLGEKPSGWLVVSGERRSCSGCCLGSCPFSALCSSRRKRRSHPGQRGAPLQGKQGAGCDNYTCIAVVLSWCSGDSGIHTQKFDTKAHEYTICYAARSLKCHSIGVKKCMHLECSMCVLSLLKSFKTNFISVFYQNLLGEPISFQCYLELHFNGY